MSRIVVSKRTLRRSSFAVVAVGILLFALGSQLFAPTYGAGIGDRQLKISTARISEQANYVLSFNLTSSTALGSIKAEFCSDGPLPDTVCTPPSGLNVGNATLTAQSGPGAFTISNASNANTLILHRTATMASPGPVSFSFANVTNPSSPGSYYVRLQTYVSTDASGNSSHDGGIAFSINNSIEITAMVPPYLIFCTGITITGLNCANAQGNYIDFGELSSTQTRHATSQMLVATNAASGYNVTMDGTTMTSGNNEIDALTGSDVSRPGTGQFGFNLRANGTPAGGTNPFGPGNGQPSTNYNLANFYRFGRGEIIAGSAVPDDNREYTASYIANIPSKQESGVYVSTITYICLATF